MYGIVHRLVSLCTVSVHTLAFLYVIAVPTSPSRAYMDVNESGAARQDTLTRTLGPAGDMDRRRVKK